MQQTLSSLCNMSRECFWPLLSSHSENECVALQSAKKKEENKDICFTSVWVHFQMFSASWVERHSNYTNRQTTMQLKVDSSVATWEKSSPSHVILNHENTLTECQKLRQMKRQTDGTRQKMQSLSQITSENLARLKFLKISVGAPTLWSSMPKMSHWLSYLGYHILLTICYWFFLFTNSSFHYVCKLNQALQFVCIWIWHLAFC